MQNTLPAAQTQESRLKHVAVGARKLQRDGESPAAQAVPGAPLGRDPGSGAPFGRDPGSGATLGSDPAGVARFGGKHTHAARAAGAAGGTRSHTAATAGSVSTKAQGRIFLAILQDAVDGTAKRKTVPRGEQEPVPRPLGSTLDRKRLPGAAPGSLSSAGPPSSARKAGKREDLADVMAAGASGIVSAALPLREQAPLDTGERKSDKAGGRLPSARAARSMDAPVTVAAARLVVVDLRGAEARVSASGAPSVQGRRAPKRSSAAEGARSKGETSPQTAGGTAVLAVRPREQQAPLVSVRGVADTDGPLTQPNQRPAAEVSPPTGRFSEMLRDEVVRQTTFLVRDGGQGEIRLVLKPESLGEVRIRVRLGEDAIEGRILVRTPEAREIFRENLPTLEAALRAQGFETARLDVAVSDGGGRERPQSETPLPAAAPVRAGEVHEQNGRIVLLSDGGQHAVYLTA